MRFVPLAAFPVPSLAASTCRVRPVSRRTRPFFFTRGLIGFPTGTARVCVHVQNLPSSDHRITGAFTCVSTNVCNSNNQKAGR